MLLFIPLPLLTIAWAAGAGQGSSSHCGGICCAPFFPGLGLCVAFKLDTGSVLCFKHLSVSF